MIFNDDSQNVATQSISGDNSKRKDGIAMMRIINKKEDSPRQACVVKVMVELRGRGPTYDRPGLDLVAVLDISQSMEGKKLEILKTAVRFVIKKLSPIDRLSVVAFSSNSKRLCPLRQMTEDSKKDIEKAVSDLSVDGANTNIAAGLEMGLKVLNDRSLTASRAVAIMLVSGGGQDMGDATQSPIHNVPVFTFSFGEDSDARVLKTIAEKSNGGTLSDASDPNNLVVAFAQCLAGLVAVVAQDLKLTVMPCASEIEKLYAGNYLQTRDDADGSVTVSFGDLYAHETRRVIVELLLPSVGMMRRQEVLRITYQHKSSEETPFKGSPKVATIERLEVAYGKVSWEVAVEEARLQAVEIIKQARDMADKDKLGEALDKLGEVEQSLCEASDESGTIEILQSELQQITRLMKEKDIYEKNGLPFVLSSETSHDSQRFATRGYAEIFATQWIGVYLRQVCLFVDYPDKPLPTVEDDVEAAIRNARQRIGQASYSALRKHLMDKNNKQVNSSDENPDKPQDKAAYGRSVAGGSYLAVRDNLMEKKP